MGKNPQQQAHFNELPLRVLLGQWKKQEHFLSVPSLEVQPELYSRPWLHKKEDPYVGALGLRMITEVKKLSFDL